MGAAGVLPDEHVRVDALAAVLLGGGERGDVAREALVERRAERVEIARGARRGRGAEADGIDVADGSRDRRVRVVARLVERGRLPSDRLGREVVEREPGALARVDRLTQATRRCRS